MRVQNKYYKILAGLPAEADAPAKREEFAPHVLVVEDNSDIRIAVTLLLEAMGCTVSKAENGREALEILRDEAFSPDLILLDLLMPGMNGWQFLQERSKHPHLAAIPTVVLSAVADTDIASDYRDVAERALKPINYEQLAGIVFRNCRKTPGCH